MNPCDDCPINDKIYECCGRFPETGCVVPFPADYDLPLYACPHLNPSGRCEIYEKRPYACQSHHCYHYDSMNSGGVGYLFIKDVLEYWRDDYDE